MTLGEKVNGFVDFITRSLTGEPGYEDGDDVFTGIRGDDGYTYEGSAVRKPEIEYQTRVSNDSNVVKMGNHGYKGHEVRIIEPRSFGDTTQIVRQLLDQKTVVLNLHLLDKEQSQRTIDFVCGAAFALGGAPQKVGDTVFVFTPNSVQLSVESKENSAFGTESLWGGNL